jgi:hypothetical protein
MSLEDQPNNTLIYEINQEIKSKKRISFSIFFYFNFYLFSGFYLSSLYKIPLLPKLGFIVFILYPNYFFYKHKFMVVNSRIHELLLINSLSKLSIIKDPITMDNFVNQYLNYFSYQKLI